MAPKPLIVSNPALPLFGDEILLEIFGHLTDSDLLSLATVSKHIHDLALLSHLGRHGMTLSDITSSAAYSMSSSGAFHAFRIARFVTTIDALHLRFDPSPELDRDVLALEKLARRFPSIKSIDLEFHLWPVRSHIRGLRRCDMESLLFTLTAESHTRPALIISPLSVAIVRPHRRRHALSAIPRIIAIVSRNRARPCIRKDDLREALILFPLMRAGGIIPSVSIRAFGDVPHPTATLGTMIVLRASGIVNLRLPPSVNLTAAEMNVMFENLTLPHLTKIEAPFADIAASALCAFIARHQGLHTISLGGLAHSDPVPERSKLVTKYKLKARAKSKKPLSPNIEPLNLSPAPPADALLQLQHLLGCAHLAAWVLTSPNPFPNLTVVTIKLRREPRTQGGYAAALHEMARRPALVTLALHLHGWAPWDARWDNPHAAMTSNEQPEPECSAVHVTDLRLTFKILSTLPPQHGAALMRFIGWFKRWRGLQEVSLFDGVPLENLCAVLRKELPHLQFTAYILSRTK